MKFCTNCGKQLAPDVRFCSNCGAALETAALADRDQATLQEEKKCLDTFYRFFKYERLSWKISGIVMLVFCLVIFCFSSLWGIIPAIAGAEDVDLAAFIVICLWFSLYGLLFLPIAIISLCMVKRCEKYMNTLYTDAKPMVTRCSSIGMIVFSAIFNNIAMAFIIVNFVMVKTKAKQLKQIVARQEAYNSVESD